MTSDPSLLAHKAIALCQSMALLSEKPSGTTRTFLSAPMRACHDLLRGRMARLGMKTWLDPIGNLRGVLAGVDPQAGRLLMGSHTDTVPNAGAYDGVLGVAIALAVLESLHDEKLALTIEVIAFSEEEGVRFAVPFLGSRAVSGDLRKEDLDLRDAMNVSVAEAIRRFGRKPDKLELARLAEDTRAFLEFHIEQGPVLDQANERLAVVTAIAGQSRYELVFTGVANHAGTTPMSLRHDALAGAAEWVSAVERTARSTDGLVATVGRM